MAIIGYARVSTGDQEWALQMDALKSAGCEKIFKDKVSGSKKQRPGLEECLQALCDGDTLIVWRLDRLGRSTKHLIEVVGELKERGVAFRSLNEGAIDTTTASGELVFQIFSAFAEFERNLIIERTRAGLDSARARGRLGGRPKISADDPRVKMAKQLHANHEIPIDEAVAMMGISRATFYKLLKVE